MAHLSRVDYKIKEFGKQLSRCADYKIDFAAKEEPAYGDHGAFENVGFKNTVSRSGDRRSEDASDMLSAPAVPSKVIKTSNS
jgi:hypothetical protein